VWLAGVVFVVCLCPAPAGVKLSEVVCSVVLMEGPAANCASLQDTNSRRSRPVKRDKESARWHPWLHKQACVHAGNNYALLWLPGLTAAVQTGWEHNSQSRQYRTVEQAAAQRLSRC